MWWPGCSWPGAAAGPHATTATATSGPCLTPGQSWARGGWADTGRQGWLARRVGQPRCNAELPGQPARGVHGACRAGDRESVTPAPAGTTPRGTCRRVRENERNGGCTHEVIGGQTMRGGCGRAPVCRRSACGRCNQHLRWLCRVGRRHTCDVHICASPPGRCQHSCPAIRAQQLGGVVGWGWGGGSGGGLGMCAKTTANTTPLADGVRTH